MGDANLVSYATRQSTQKNSSVEAEEKVKKYEAMVSNWEGINVDIILQMANLIEKSDVSSSYTGLMPIRMQKDGVAI